MNYAAKKESAKEAKLNAIAINLIKLVPEPPYEGEISDDNVEMALEFIKNFPIGTVFSIDELNIYLEDKGIVESPIPKNEMYKRMAKTGTRTQFKKQVNEGAKSKQWPAPANRFQIVIHKHGDRWRVITFAEAIELERNNLRDKPVIYIENKKKEIIKMLMVIDPSSCKSPQEQYSLLKAVNDVSSESKPKLPNYNKQRHLPLDPVNDEWLIDD